MGSSEPKNVAVQRAIDFLGKHEALEVGGSPWGSYDQDEDVSQVNYDRIMDNRDPLRINLPPEFAEALEGALEDDGLGRVLSGSQPVLDTTGPVSWDVCAWYQPLHFFGQDWGIYIREECLLKLAIRIARYTDRPKFLLEKARAVAKRMTGGPSVPTYWRLHDPEIFIRAAFLALFLHEHYHHRVECLGLRLHVVTRTSLYIPYTRNVYLPAKGTDDLLEEALANACMYLRLAEDT